MAKPGGGGEKTDFESNVLFIGIGIVLGLLLAWYLLGPYISAIMGILRRYEMIPFAYFFSNAAAIQQRLVDIKGSSLDFNNMVEMLSVSGYYVRWLYMPLLPILAYVLLIKCTRLKYQKQHTMASLTKQESVLWPEIAPVVGKQDILMKGDEHVGEWAVAMTEWEFVLKHKLAKRGVPLNVDATRAVFVSQLGPRWTGVENLPAHRRGLYAAFLLRIVGESAQGLAVLRSMSKTFAAGGLKGMDTSFADAVIAKHGQHPHLLRVITQHAYVNTVLATMLQLSRADGVLASPMFIWLKTVDRGLFYLLNGVGRYAFFVECAGVSAHWLYEKTLGQACPTPMVEHAIAKRGLRNVSKRPDQVEMKMVLISGLEMALLEYTEDDAIDRLYK